MANVLRFPATTPEPADDTAARESALDTRSSCIVEAPAGSGKTGLLMQRFLKLLAEPSVAQPEEVLAITFTNKAAAELRERVLAQLEAAHHNTPVEDPFQQATRDLALAALARDAQLGWSLLDRPHRLNLRTIDSVCAEIANALPLLSGSGAPRQPTTDADPLYHLAAQRTLLQLGGSDPALHNALRTVLLHRDGSLADCESLLAKMLAAREQWGELVPLGPGALDDATLDTEVRARLERSLESIVCAGLSRALRLMPPALLHDLTHLAATLGLEPGYNGAPSPIAICANQHESPAAVADHLDHWLALIHLVTTASSKSWRKGFNKNHIGFELPKAAKAELQRVIADLDAHGSGDLCAALCDILVLPPSQYPDEQWHVAKALFHVLRRALAELRVLFAERGECDFTELALAAREALHADSSAPDVALAFGGKLRHLLVDEMQDTSSGQYELIDLLTRSWDGHTQTLFLVGDPKQSIYLFRQARVERFLRTMREQRLGEIPLTPLRLTTNFRSQATLVHDFNHNFERLFPSLEASQQATDVPFVAAVANRASTSDNGIHWRTALLDKPNPLIPTDNPRRNHELQQAREIRLSIERWLAQPLPAGRTKPWSIAVLARTRSHLRAIVAELKHDFGQGPIAYRAVDIDPLDERPEVLDALALTRALLHPADRVAWLAVLHAPWCGLGLADLLTLTGEGDSTTEQATIASLIAARTHLLSDEAQQLLARAWTTLGEAIATTGRTSIAIHVERTWRSLGGDAPLTAEQQLNVQRFFAVLGELEPEGGRLDLTALHSRLRKLYAEPATGNIAVDLLTMHKAKGLEWDVVLVPSLERQSARSSSDFLNWLELDGSHDESASIILAPIYGKGNDSDQLNKWLARVKEAREDAERKRLFYVACTRAREELHLFAACKLKDNGDLATPAHGSLLKSCWAAAEEHFTNLTAAPADLTSDLTRSLEVLDTDDFDSGLALAATAEAQSTELAPPLIHRLPLSFHPEARFTAAAARRLPYIPAESLAQAPIFDRPEGSFAVRAFGNVVHRYLQLLAVRLEATTPEALLAELPTWQPRLAASLRGEGLAPTLADREAARALRALTQSLTDTTGHWILTPHPQAASERALTLAAGNAMRSLRADRTFLAAATPLSTGEASVWIIDFKTAEQGSRSNEDFEAAELAKYRAQLEAYAAIRRSLPNGDLPIQLGLFYPLVPRLIHWTSVPTQLL
jgi:ATP-dependent helicase/nuclease subunit A